MHRRSAVAMLLLGFAFGGEALACDAPVSICPHDGKASFALIQGGHPAAVIVDAGADSAVRRVADSFAEDLKRVGGSAALRLDGISQAKGNVVIIGVAGQSPVIDGLIKAGKLDASDVKGWEAYREIVMDKPMPGIPRALVIVGADRRGAVFGTYDISEKIGVSPQYWFADVPVKRQANLFVTAGSRRDQPKVKYRGFFINDEAPAFSTWTQKKFGGANHKAYEHIFEYLLRMKGNFMWPAMWAPRAFNDDDPQNMVLADAMGVVMGTSHHEPMTRAQDEWHRNTDKGVTGGKWDYTLNAENLRKFWRGGIERMMSKGDGKGYEAVVTVGMRGDGDEPMAEGTATKLLETIVSDQRQIISEVTGKPASETPQVWALYKEVQDYYDHGMTVPDDVTLLFSDDNWGQIRRLPTKDLYRKGGYGVYYHFDYVGGPRNYKWLNTNQIEKTWQQMDLAYRRGARQLWVVNVGDIKPMEFPLQFFLKEAWDPEAMTPEALKAYPKEWAAKTFGAAQAAAIADLVTRYSQLAARRKPELIDENSFALGTATGKTLDGGEFGAMIGEWDRLEKTMLAVKSKLAADQRDAYFELVEHPISALANLYHLYYDVAWNRRLAEANDPRANLFAAKADAAFQRDRQLADAYHKLKGGKWDGMMLQTHIGYTTWQQPAADVMPELRRLPMARAVAKIQLAYHPSAPAGVVAIEAQHFTRAVGGKGLTWTVVPHLGRTLGAVLALPQGRDSTTEQDGVRLEYAVKIAKPGDLTVRLIMVPTIDTSAANGIRIGVSLDNGPVETLRFNLIPAPGEPKTDDEREWNLAVRDNAHALTATFPGTAAGKHVVKVWRLDDNAVLQKLVIGAGPLGNFYLGPPETARARKHGA